MKKFVFLGLAVLLAGCTQVSTTDKNAAVSVANQVTYVRDDRSDLCFAILSSKTYGGWYSVSITNVACTDKVLALIQH